MYGMMHAGTSIVYPAASASEAASPHDQSLETLQAVMTQPLTDRTKVTPSKRKGCAHGMVIVICDEMDQLMSSAQEVLYDLFFLPQVRYCHITLKPSLYNAEYIICRISIPFCCHKQCMLLLASYLSADSSSATHCCPILCCTAAHLFLAFHVFFMVLQLHAMFFSVLNHVCTLKLPRQCCLVLTIPVTVSTQTHLQTGPNIPTHTLLGLLQLLKSRLILVGIANSLDLTERLLPGLEARGCKPRLVAFPTYTRNQITAVLQERLDCLPGAVFAAKALEFCARKVKVCPSLYW